MVRLKDCSPSTVLSVCPVSQTCSDELTAMSDSDEAHFHLNGAINNHNNILWGAEPPEISERYLKGPKAVVLNLFMCSYPLSFHNISPYPLSKNFLFVIYLFIIIIIIGI